MTEEQIDARDELLLITINPNNIESLIKKHHPKIYSVIDWTTEEDPQDFKNQVIYDEIREEYGILRSEAKFDALYEDYDHCIDVLEYGDYQIAVWN